MSRSRDMSFWRASPRPAGRPLILRFLVYIRKNSLARCARSLVIKGIILDIPRVPNDLRNQFNSWFVCGKYVDSSSGSHRTYKQSLCWIRYRKVALWIRIARICLGIDRLKLSWVSSAVGKLIKYSTKALDDLFATHCRTECRSFDICAVSMRFDGWANVCWVNILPP